MRYVLVFLLIFVAPTSNANEGDAMALYRAVASGQKDFNSLTPREKQQVITIHSIVTRNSCGNYSGRCAEACEAKERLEEAANDLARCAKRASLSDDCSRKFRDTKDAFFEYENAVSDVSGECD